MREENEHRTTKILPPHPQKQKNPISFCFPFPMFFCRSKAFSLVHFYLFISPACLPSCRISGKNLKEKQNIALSLPPQQIISPLLKNSRFLPPYATPFHPCFFRPSRIASKTRATFASVAL